MMITPPRHGESLAEYFERVDAEYEHFYVPCPMCDLPLEISDDELTLACDECNYERDV